MKILAVDDEDSLLEALKKALKNVCPNADIAGFSLVREAVDYAKNNFVELAFLDIQMPDINGIDLAKALKETNRDINIIFVTGYDQYMKSAFDIYASGYLIKPVNETAIKKELSHLRNPLKDKEPNRITIKTFGNFDVLVNGVFINFKRAASKELLAYLVDKRGKCCSLKEIAETLFSDRNYDDDLKAYLGVIISNMINTLKIYGIENIIERKFNSYALITNMVWCDFYEFEKNYPSTVNFYSGEYMFSYMWADKTNEYIKRKIASRKSQ